VLTPGEPDSTVRTFLQTNGITLLYWGANEAATGFDPTAQSYLAPIYHDGTVTIYRVRVTQ
jgi:hypothetical protein